MRQSTGRMVTYMLSDDPTLLKVIVSDDPTLLKVIVSDDPTRE
jgi:hypothetical protein